MVANMRWIAHKEIDDNIITRCGLAPVRVHCTLLYAFMENFILLYIVYFIVRTPRSKWLKLVHLIVA